MATNEELERHIVIAADSIAELRVVDVFRVLESREADGASAAELKELADYIVRERSDLADEVREVLEELDCLEGDAC